jgi:hypothetical protein
MVRERMCRWCSLSVGTLLMMGDIVKICACDTTAQNEFGCSLTFSFVEAVSELIFLSYHVFDKKSSESILCKKDSEYNKPNPVMSLPRNTAVQSKTAGK